MSDKLLNTLTNKLVNTTKTNQIFSVSALSIVITFLMIQFSNIIISLNQSIDLFKTIYFLAGGNINTYYPFLFSVVGLGITGYIVLFLSAYLSTVILKSLKEIYFNERLYNNNYSNTLLS